jgi:hypothetical protein
MNSDVSPMERARPQPIARVVLLGASNLRLSLPIVMQTAKARLGGPLAFYVAHGFGRSYGMWSRIPGRALPGITQCDLWNDLARSPSLPTFAMLTDIGNDLLYGASPEQLISWVEECVDRLGAHEARIMITELPISSILATSSLRYKIFRTIFFPPSRLTLDHACRSATVTNQGLRILARERECALVAMPKHWYGIDPIHHRWLLRRTAWQAIVDAWLPSHEQRPARVLSAKYRLSIELATPRHWRLFGRQRSRAQPCVTFDDGSTLALY